jgi:cytochrome c551/c552
MKSIFLLFAAAGLVIAGRARAQSGDAVLKSKGCLGCHDFNKVGPAYKDIAAQCKGN